MIIFGNITLLISANFSGVPSAVRHRDAGCYENFGSPKKSVIQW